MKLNKQRFLKATRFQPCTPHIINQKNAPTWLKLYVQQIDINIQSKNTYKCRLHKPRCQVCVITKQEGKTANCWNQHAPTPPTPQPSVLLQDAPPHPTHQSPQPQAPLQSTIVARPIAVLPPPRPFHPQAQPRASIIQQSPYRGPTQLVCLP